MRNRLLFSLLLLLSSFGISTAQLVGTNAYLQGAYLEIGMISDGAFGAPAPPAGYHPHFGSLAEVYDYGHDGWTVGTPPYMGDYTYPGYPFEGWEVQWGGTARVQGFQSGFITGGGATITGSSITSYANIGGNKHAYWQGTTGPGGIMLMKSDTRVDTLASAVVVTVKFYNTSAVTTIPQVYYMRSTDPDNDQTWAGGGFPTDNYVDIQNATIPNPKHKVEVTGIGRSSTRPPLTLATKDSRAVAFIYNWWPLAITEDLASGWAMTGSFGGTSYYNVGANHPGDIGIGLIWKLCDILPGDSTSITYAYLFNGAAGIDDVGALPDPIMTVAGTPVSGGGHGHDTVDGCTMPGVDSVLIDIPYGSDKSWITGSWTWTPATALSATSGTRVYVRLTAVPGYITYTVTGKTMDTGLCAANLTDTFYITVHSCHLAYANDPCIGDALHLGMVGDSIGATYRWTSPTGGSSTLHNWWINPTTWADTGTYRVIRTIGGVDDTDYFHVVIHPLPVVNVASNIPKPCDPFVNPFNLFVNLDSAGETFSWSGPKGFTSTLQNPSITPFDSTMEGTYTVTGTTIWGCKASNSTTVWPGIVPRVEHVIHYGCVWDTVELINKTYNANYYEWKFEDGTPDDIVRSTVHIFRNPNKVVYVRMRATNAHCDTTIIDTIDLRHKITAEFDPTPDTLCFNSGVNSVTFNNSSFADDSMFNNLAIAGYRWLFADGTTDNSMLSPTHTFTAPGIYPVQLVVSDAMGCEDSVIHKVFVVDIQVKSFHDTLLCVSQPLALKNEIVTIPAGEWPYKFSWSQSPVVNLDNDTVQIPNLFGVGLFTDILTVTIPGVVPDGCPVTNTMVINSVLGKKLQKLTVSQTIDYGSSIQLNASNEVIYYWMPNDGSLDNNNINNPIATPKRTTTYTVYGLDDNGCKDSAYITVFVDTTMEQDVPTAFSPNGDGVNDVFRPVGMKFQNLVEFRVYNRWGQEIFYSNNREVGWDGTYHGTKQDLGVYNYMIIVARPGQDNIAYKGNVTLIR